MGYKFPLATVLQVRVIREEREERMLQQILFEVSQAKRVIEQIDEAMQRSNESRHTKFSALVEGREIQAAYGEFAGLKQHKAELLNHLSKLEELRLRQVKVLDQARCDREMLSDMKEKQSDEYYLGMAKREQKMLDDNFAARRNR